MKTETTIGIFWAIKNEYGFYVGTWQKRSDAIHYHLTALGKTWKYCLNKGDQVVKVKVTEIVEELNPRVEKLPKKKLKRAAPGQKNVRAYRIKNDR